MKATSRARRSEPVSPDQFIAGGPGLLAIASDCADRILGAPNRANLLTVAPLCAHALRGAVDQLEGSERVGAYVGLYALARRLSAEVCTCDPIQVDRRRHRITTPQNWCFTCHARELLGLRNP